jgi:ferrochelatase
LKETFLEHGGDKFSAVKCLNDSDESITMLEAIVRDELQGWI